MRADPELRRLWQELTDLLQKSPLNSGIDMQLRLIDAPDRIWELVTLQSDIKQ